MNNRTEMLDARQYFEELHGVVIALPFGIINQIAGVLMKSSFSTSMQPQTVERRWVKK